MSPTDQTPDTSSERIASPGELAATIPYLLGFHPHESLVLVGLADSTLVVTARLDLDAAVDDKDEALDETVSALRRGGVNRIVGAIYPGGTEDASAGAARADLRPDHLELVARLKQTATRDGCTLADCLLVTDGRWRSCLCNDPTCCPAAGTPMPQRPSAVQVAAVCNGVVVAPNRESLADRFARDPDRDPLRTLIEDLNRATSTVTPLHPPAEHDAHLAQVIIDTCQARGDNHAGTPSPPAPLGDHDLVFLAVALSRVAVRDKVWTAVDQQRIDCAGLWLELARRLPEPWNAAPLFLYGWHTWRRGDGAVASLAAQRALDADPDYSAADLLLTILARGVDPRGLPPLKPSTD